MRFLVLLLAGCSEYDLTPDDKEPAFDTGDPVDTFDTDTDTIPVETGDSAPPPECPAADLSPSTVAIDETCAAAAVGTFTPVIEWNDTTPGDIMATPVVGNLTDDNGDGVIDGADMPDIVASTSAGGIVAMSGDGSGIHWQITSGNVHAAPAIGDLDGDGWAEVVAIASGGYIAYHGDDGSVYWSSSETTMSGEGSCGSVGIYDLDADGAPEIVSGSVILNGQTGVLRGAGAHGIGTGIDFAVAYESVAADIDLDGVQEVVVGNALYDADGATIWYNRESDGYVAVANFDSDPEGEIVVASAADGVRLQDDDGTVLWTTGMSSGRLGPPTIADFDGDGEPEIGVAGYDLYAVLDTDGTELWRNRITDGSSGCTGSSVFDFEGDGLAEVVFADEQDVWVFDGATGTVKLREATHASLTCTEYPVIADVDNDGHAEIVYASYAYGGDPTRGITVLGDADDSWMPGRRIWNQHGYNITNVGEDGEIPAVPATNWETYNSFRSGDLTAVTGSDAVDAVISLSETCAVECDRGYLRVVVRVGSAGTEALPAGASIAVYASQAGAWTLLETRATTAAVPAGETSIGIVFELDPADVPDGLLRFVVDDDGTGAGVLPECHEDNNVLEVSDGLCG